MNELLTYFAIFYVIGIFLFAFFIRFYLRKKRLKEQEKLLDTKKHRFVRDKKSKKEPNVP